MATGRYFGFVADPVVGGSNFDTVAGVIPAPDTFWPVTGFSVDEGEDAIDRNDEIRNVRGQSADLPFKHNPKVTVRGKLYPGIAKKLVRLAQGVADQRAGAPPAAITHTLDPAGYGPDGLQAIHIHLFRDGLYERIVGCQLGQLTLTIPNDGEATFEAMFEGLYRLPASTAYPAVAGFDDVDEDWVFTPRDSRLFFDASPTPVAKVRALTLVINNQFREPDFDWDANVEAETIGGKEYRLWHPARKRLSTARTVTGSLSLSEVQVARLRDRDFRVPRSWEVEADAQELTTTPVVREMMRLVLPYTQLVGGGIDEASRDADINTQFDIKAAIDPSTGRDLRVEFVDDSNVDITV